MTDRTNTVANLAAALANAQGELTAVRFDATNPFLKNKYASLGAIIETAKPVLAKYGLSVSQMVVGGAESVGITTVLMHSSGEWMESTVMLPVGDEKGKSMAQVAGSVISYLRRYALAAVLGMYADEDTDGNKPPAKQESAKQTQPPVLTMEIDPPVATMSLEMAESEVNRDGVRYGDLPGATLSHMANALAKQLDKGYDEEKARKLDAARTILASRK